MRRAAVRDFLVSRNLAVDVFLASQNVTVEVFDEKIDVALNLLYGIIGPENFDSIIIQFDLSLEDQEAFEQIAREWLEERN